MKLFQLVMKVMSPSVPSAGPTSGSTMFQKMRHSLQPSMRAASSRSCGITLPMYWRIRNTPSAPAAPGMYSARGSSIQPSNCITMKLGIMLRKAGSIIDASTIANSTRLKRNSYIAKAKPPIEHSSRLSTVVIVATYRLMPKLRQ
jgi:hypothetical protein